jgi:hypothetical protein
VTISLLLAAMAFQSLPSPMLERWEGVTSDAAGSSAIDPQSIRRSGDQVSVLVRTRIHRTASNGGPAMGVLRYVFDCRANTVRQDGSEVYEGDGRFIGASDARTLEEPIRAGSPNLAVRERICRAR